MVVQYLMEQHNFVLTEEDTVMVNCCMCESITGAEISNTALNNMHINPMLGFMLLIWC